MPHSEANKVVRFIARLLQLTQEGGLAWEAVDPPGNRSNIAYSATVGERNLRVYSYTVHASDPLYDMYEKSAIAAGALWNMGKPSRETTVTVLEVLDQRGRVLYAFRNNAGIADLYNAVSYSAAKIDSLIDEVLAGE